MRPLPLLSRSSNPAWRATRVAIAAGTLAGLTVLGACSDISKTTSPAVSSPRNSTIEGGLAFAKTVIVCVDASSPPGTYKFTNSQLDTQPNIAGFDGADGGTGTTTENTASEYPVAVGSGGCTTVLTRSSPDLGILGSTTCPTGVEAGCVNGGVGADTFSGITLTATTIPVTAAYDHTDCLLDGGTKLAFPNPCGTGNNPTRAYANFDHGSKITFFFVPATPPPIPVLFVIGDLVPWTLQAAAINTNKPIPPSTVNFWGSQWWKNNPMSLFHSNGWPSFKGYASVVNRTPVEGAPCGTWISRVGNSPPPPQTIPDLVGVIITNNVVKIGPDLGGGIQEIIVVRSDGGYGPNPGHDGNGPVVGILCGGAE